MDHTDASGTDMAERYVLGEMSERERERYEAHFFDCADCADEVTAAFVFLENAHESMCSENAPVLAGGGPGARTTRSVCRRRKALFRPVPSGAVAVFVALVGGPAAYLGFHRIPQLERRLAEAEALQPASWHFLTVSRSEPQLVRVSRSARMIALTLGRSAVTGHRYYRCELRDARGGERRLLSALLPAPPGGDEVDVVIPVSRLDPGCYSLVLAGLESPSGEGVAVPDLARYTFAFEYEEEP